MKKVISAALSAVLACSMALPALAADFSDISEERYAWARPYIEEMADLGLISGYDDGTYRPDNNVTRLEAICLFARAMGATNPENAEIVDFALAHCQDTLDEYELNFGQKEVAFMLYRGALKLGELEEYLGGTRKNEAMPRYEAAIMMTKAMGAEKEAKKELMVDLSYTDAKDIPSKASQYVYYVTQQQLMTGMDDGSFGPENSVLRSQVAVMLSKLVDKLSISFDTGKLVEINTDAKEIGILDSEGDAFYMEYTDQTAFCVEGILTQTKNVSENVWAVFTYVDDALLYVDIVNAIPDETIKGIYKGYASENDIISINLLAEGESKAKYYECAEDVSLRRGDSLAYIREFVSGDYVTLEMSRGKVQAVIGEAKTTTITAATIESIAIDDDLTITISHADEQYDGVTYTVSGDAIAKKNGDVVDMSKIYKGDIATLTLEYGVVTEINAKSTTKYVTGTIKELKISATPSMTVVENGVEAEYDIPTGVKILINNEEKTLYDFRVGDTVKLEIESQAIKKITATAVQVTSKKITGIVSNVNTAYGFIKVQYVDGTNAVDETVYCKDSTTKFISAQGKDVMMKNLSEGATVTVHGNVKNGAYEASIVIIEAE